MTAAFKAACIQTNSAREIAPSVEAACRSARQACDAGADLILFPENVAMMEPRSRLSREKALPEASHIALAAFKDLAKETGAWVLAGSLGIQLEPDNPDGKLANRSFLIDSEGDIKARYDKIHMFDVELGDGQRYLESGTFQPGDQAVVADTPWGKLGMTICYDIRFAYLYRELAKRGADFICSPAAFTKVSGEAHWHVLQRARAIETGCYVFAPAQCGTHAENRQTYGHSLIVDPWGTVVADAGDAPGFVIADIDPSKVAAARAKIPSLNHDRPFS